jgi:hypothetical protein
VPERDTIDKIVNSYFAAITRQTFTYRDKKYEPKELVVSPLLFRGFLCPSGCGGCCPRFSLDYLPTDELPITRLFSERFVKINNQDFRIFSDMQETNSGHHCKHLILSNGRCGVHGKQPFSCDFELIRCIHYDNIAVLTQKLFGRGWAFLRTDGQRGAKCEMTEVTKETIADVIRKLNRLKQWAEYFHIDHCLDVVIDWCQNSIHTQELVIPKDTKIRTFTRSMTLFDEPLVRIE